MARTTNLTPKFGRSVSAEQELTLTLPAGESMIGQNMGGMSVFSNSFKRGYGDKVFGQNEEGIWLGAADFENAPFRVDMDGNVTAVSATLADYTTEADVEQIVDDNAITQGGTGQQLSGDVNVGNSTGGFLKMDGVNKRFLVNIAGTNRGLFGDDGT